VGVASAAAPARKERRFNGNMTTFRNGGNLPQ
jgi:hypothetical protein